MANTTRDLAGQASEKAKDLAGSAAQTARNAAATVGHKAEDLTERLGGSVASMGETIRQHAPREGYLGQAAGAVADTVESGGHYIEREGLNGMANDLTTLIKNNPIPALLVGFGLGFLLARITRS
jgi:hypothetical protein